MNGWNFATIVARQSCRLVWDIRQWMQGHALPAFYNKRSHFQSRGDSNCLQGVGKASAVCLFNMGRVGSKLFFDQVDDQLSDFGTEEKDEIFKYTTFNWKSTHISNYAVWRFMDDGKEADSVQCQINRRTLSIKMTDSGVWRHFVQCVTRSCEERMISLKILKLFLALAKSSKAPFVRDDIKLLNSQKWAVIEKEVRSENGRRRGLSGIQGAVCSVANQMKEKSGVMPTLAAAAASELGRTSGPKCVGVIGHGIVGKDIPIMARLAKARRWSKR